MRFVSTRPSAPAKKTTLITGREGAPSQIRHTHRCSVPSYSYYLKVTRSSQKNMTD